MKTDATITEKTITLEKKKRSELRHTEYFFFYIAVVSWTAENEGVCWFGFLVGASFKFIYAKSDLLSMKKSTMSKYASYKYVIPVPP